MTRLCLGFGLPSIRKYITLVTQRRLDATALSRVADSQLLLLCCEGTVRSIYRIIEFWRTLLYETYTSCGYRRQHNPLRPSTVAMVALARSSLCALSDEPSNEHFGHAPGLRRHRFSSSSGSLYRLLLGRPCSGGSQSLRIPWRGFLAQRCWFISCKLFFVLVLAGRPASCFKIVSAASFASKTPPVKDVLFSPPTESASECRYVFLSSRTTLELPRDNLCPCRQVTGTIQYKVTWYRLSGNSMFHCLLAAVCDYYTLPVIARQRMI